MEIQVLFLNTNENLRKTLLHDLTQLFIPKK